MAKLIYFILAFGFILITIFFSKLKSCPSNCSNNGVCNTSTGVCSCNTGYTGNDCNIQKGVEGSACYFKYYDVNKVCTNSCYAVTDECGETAGTIVYGDGLCCHRGELADQGTCIKLNNSNYKEDTF
jgi:hypothetical protein